MSVIVKDVVMPDECMYCEFGMYGFYGTRCQLRDNGRRIIPMECIDNGTRPDWCPLVEIPEGARLIDAKQLKKKVLKWMPPDPCGVEEKEFPFETDICVSMLMEIDEAPTVFKED